MINAQPHSTNGFYHAWQLFIGNRWALRARYVMICFDSFELLLCLIAGLSRRELKLADEGKNATPTKSGSNYGLKKKSFEK